MYAQVVRVQFQPGKVDEAISIYKGSVAPAARGQKGFKSAYLLVDRQGNRGLGFSLWETEADVVALATSGYFQEQIAKFAGVFAAPPEREVYEVAVQA